VEEATWIPTRLRPTQIRSLRRGDGQLQHSRPPSILVVATCPASRDLLKRVLGREGYRVARSALRGGSQSLPAETLPDRQTHHPAANLGPPGRHTAARDFTGQSAALRADGGV
jgi:hypothetical protein